MYILEQLEHFLIMIFNGTIYRYNTQNTLKRQLFTYLDCGLSLNITAN